MSGVKLITWQSMKYAMGLHLGGFVGQNGLRSDGQWSFGGHWALCLQAPKENWGTAFIPTLSQGLGVRKWGREPGSVVHGWDVLWRDLRIAKWLITTLKWRMLLLQGVLVSIMAGRWFLLVGLLGVVALCHSVRRRCDFREAWRARGYKRKGKKKLSDNFAGDGSWTFP